jgi:VWFA-related protein
MTKILNPDQQGEHVQVIAQKSANRIFIYSFFGSVPSESVQIEVDAPYGINVVIWGANPEVLLSGIQGTVRVHTFTGDVTVEHLTSSVSLISERGNINFSTALQPEGDARLESTHGNIGVSLLGPLNMKSWIRAGRVLTWGKDVTLENTSLEDQLGIGGPLFYASSLKGDVRIDFDSENVGPTLIAGTQTDEPAPSAAAPPERAADRGGKQPPVLKHPDERPPKESERVSGSPGSNPGNPNTGAGPQTGTPAQGGGYSFKVAVDSVYLNVSVRDRYTSRSVHGLQKEDFLVYENGVMQQVDQMVSGEAPFNLLLLLDVSGSTRSHIDLIKEASIDFTREIKENDQIAVAAFNSKCRLLQDFTSNRYDVARAISRLRSSGGTAFYDALETSIDDYMRGTEGRGAIVVFTDGVDNQLTGDFSNGSDTTFEELFYKIQEIDPIIYTIFLETEEYTKVTRRRRSGGNPVEILSDIFRGKLPSGFPSGGGALEEAKQQLLAIADQTGGRMYAPQKIDDLFNIYSEIADDLRIQYQLGYNSTDPSRDGSWREIKVKIYNNPDAVVRTRKGYYARSSNRSSHP